MEHPIQCDCPKNNERMSTMFNEIVTKEEMKFKDLEGKIFKCMCQVDGGIFLSFFCNPYM